MQTKKLFEIQELCKDFKIGRKGVLHAVDHVSFDIFEGETVSLVGESGCGKTTCGRTCIGIYPKTSGMVLYEGSDVHAMKGDERQRFKKEVQMVFQDSYSSLDPRMTIADIVAEGIDIHGMSANRKERQERIHHYLGLVGFDKEHANRFPHEFSGGQRQRIGIARALAVEPKFLLLDEPVSALDVSIQAQIINLLIKLQRDLGLTYLFVAHDLSVVKMISDRIVVMYLGEIVEITTSDKLYDRPLHPYTRALISAIPVPDPRIEAKRAENNIYLKEEGSLQPSESRVGCKFCQKCAYSKQICTQSVPVLMEYESGHFAACHLLGEYNI